MNPPDNLTRSASVRWTGDIARGSGAIAVESGLVSANYSFGTRFAKEPGTNPEELLGASHAACFTMAFALGLTRAGHPPTSIDTAAHVDISKDGEGFTITNIALVTTVDVPGIDDAALHTAANGAKEHCPISKALAAVPVSLEVKRA
ncbi:MAG: OsmC family protein [Vulcanimicrobiaceae bacterium]